MKKKIIIVLVVLLAGGGFVAKSMFLKPAVAKEKIEGTIYILPKQFTANLKDGRYATVTVALVLAPGQSTGAAAGGEGGGPAPPEGFGTLPEEAAVRDIITNLLTNQSSKTLTSDSGREHLKTQILAAIKSGTDVKVHEILFTDLAVQ
jgi:flagellar basal body-associated protein FliL